MTGVEVMVYVMFPVVGYLLGSIPFAWVIGKAKGVDIRTVGSRNIGATNLGRTLGKRFFWYAFLLDAGKGFVPVLTAALYAAQWTRTLPSWAPLLTAIACVLGHTFPVWLKFKGGKGVATSFGVVLGFWPLYTLAGMGGGMIFLGMLMVYRYISLASMTGVTGFAVLVMVLGRGYLDGHGIHLRMAWGELEPLVVVAWLFAGLIAFRHRGNIGRLLKGTEPQVGQREVECSRLGK